MREAAYSRGMPEWVGSAATVVTALVALAALIVSIWASRRLARKREFELLLERIDREAAERDERFEREVAKREEAIPDVLDRSDRSERRGGRTGRSWRPAERMRIDRGEPTVERGSHRRAALAG